MNKHDLIYLVGNKNYVPNYNKDDIGLQIVTKLRENNEQTTEDVLAEILLVLEPDISFLRFRHLGKLIDSKKEKYLLDEYDTDYKVQTVETINLNELYEKLIQLGINPTIQRDGFQIENFEPMIKNSIFFKEQDGQYIYDLRGINHKKRIDERKNWIKNVNMTLNNNKGQWCVDNFFRNIDNINFQKELKMTIEELYILYMNSIHATYPTITTEKTK